MRKSLSMAVVFIAALVVAVTGQYWANVYSADLHWADEGSHFINGLLVHDYVAHGRWGNPIAFAMEYYMHYPKVAIGHWPPFYYPLEALFFFLAGPSPRAALLLEALFAAGLATAVSAVVTRQHGWLAGILAALITLAAPDVFSGIEGVMLDVPLAFFAFLATICWAKYLESLNWRWSLAFALAASAAILTKGNGFYLALVPPFSLLILRRFDHARQWSFWLPAAVVAVLTVPWYLATYKIAADGFNYSWGLRYSILAFGVYGRVFLVLIGVPGLLFAALGAAGIVLRRYSGFEDGLGVTVLAAVAAGVLYHCAVPVALQPRYLTPLVPDLIVLAAFALHSPMPSRIKASASVIAATLILMAEAEFAKKPDLGMARAARLIAQNGERNPVLLVGSTPGGEGAITAEMASEDRHTRNYVLRGFEVLGKGNFMGTRYKARFSSPQALRQWIEQAGIGWVVLDTSIDSLKWKHNQQLRDLLGNHPLRWEKFAELRNPQGSVLVYRLFPDSEHHGNFSVVIPELIPSKVLGRYHPQ